MKFNNRINPKIKDNKPEIVSRSILKIIDCRKFSEKLKKRRKNLRLEIRTLLGIRLRRSLSTGGKSKRENESGRL